MKQSSKLTRRQLLRMGGVLGATATLAAACGQPAAPAAPTEAPKAEASKAEAPKEEVKPTEAPKAAAGGKLTVLHRQEYFKDLEVALKEKTEAFIKEKGMEADVSTVNPEVFGDFMAKMEAAVAAGNPPDLAYHGNSVAQIFDKDLGEDHSAIVAEAESKFGKIVPSTAARNAKFQDKWRSVPHSSNIGGWFVRKDLAKAAGVDLSKFKTLQERLEAAIKMSDPAKEVAGWGLTVNKSGDGHGLITTVFQAFGGRAVDETGKKVTFNSPETVAGIQWLADIYTKEEYKKILPPGVESWTDTSNNEAYLAGKIAVTTNAPSVYAKARADKNPVFENTAWLGFPTTNDGKMELGSGGNQWYTIFKGAKNPDGAKQVIMYVLDPATFAPLSKLGGGLVMPAYEKGWTDDLLAYDPNFPSLKETMFNPSDYTGFAFPAQTNAAIDAAFATGFLSALMSDVITGKSSAADAVKEYDQKIKDIFNEKGLPQ
jgi:multiple sugar transport system substrate-binding protein